jgi:molybdopterin-containing oxidoreductase family membrane subunit
MGQPIRALNMLMHPTPGSVLFWDAAVLNGYLILNIIIGWNVLEAERNGVPTAIWVKPLIYLSIPFAFGIHTVTAFLYCGLPGRGFWLTAILAPRFLASAFAAGPAFIIILSFIIKKVTNFDAGKEAIQTISKIVTYALIANVFFLLCEVFVAFYSKIPEHTAHLKYLFVGLHGHGVLAPWMWTSIALMLIAILLLLIPATRNNEFVLGITCVFVLIGTWIDKGLGLIAGGFVPSPLHHVNEYIPTIKEIFIGLGIYGIGFLILTVLFKIAITIREEVDA